MASIRDFFDFNEQPQPASPPISESFSEELADAKLKHRLGRLGKTSAQTRSQIDSMGVDRKRFGKLAREFSTGVHNIGGEQAALRRAASAVAGADPRTATTQGGSLSEALRRAKARQGIVARGDNSIRQQRLKDRLTLVRSGLTRKSAAIDLQGAGQQIRAGVNLNAANARNAISAGRAGAFGATAGAFAGILKGNKDDNGSFFDFGKKNAPDPSASSGGPN